MHSNSSSETKKIAAEFARRLRQPAVVGLTGELGAGKTTFVQGMAEGLGIDPNDYVNSPTFTLVNEYEGPKGPLVHVDLYRIEKPLEIETLGLEEYRDAIVVIEWPEKLLQKTLDFDVRIEIDSGDRRRITIREI